MALNPIIKFSTLFGLLAVEIAVKMQADGRRGTRRSNYAPMVGVVLLAVALVFVWRSFYAMRIPKDDPGPEAGRGRGRVGGGQGALNEELNHRGTETQRRKSISLLCASVVQFFPTRSDPGGAPQGFFRFPLLTCQSFCLTLGI